MIHRLLENVSIWLVDWGIVSVMGNTMPPRDPKDDDDAEDEGDDDLDPGGRQGTRRIARTRQWLQTD